MSSPKPKEKTTGRIGRKLKVIYEQVDKAVARGHAQFNTTCERGCNHCCYLTAVMTIPEALLILDYLSKRSFAWGWFESKLPQLREWIEILENRETTRESWFQSKTPCLFLQKGECSVYEVRPVACRSHVSTDDPAKCSHDADKEQNVRFLDLRDLDNYVWNESMRFMAREKLPLGYAPMPMALVWAHLYWTRGRKEFLKALEGTALGDGDQTNLISWIHLVRSDPRFTEVIDMMLNPKEDPNATDTSSTNQETSEESQEEGDQKEDAQASG